ncbi:MAG: hypothetical protein EZS28_009110 [Streblomastix strix]|uniref:Uncharacterized protein n=1 Tax=Streblomastix strix TaxID=222440 RepID=A0A5J4WKL8_9EUKA|nr:MAG: hypothetical protein EZS28_009110 [Streblomastix strix]
MKLNSRIQRLQNAQTTIITYAVEVLPSEINLQTQNAIINYFGARGCQGWWKQATLGFEVGGVVSSQCVSNKDSNLPNSIQATADEVPPKPTQCDDGQTDFKVYSKGFKYGEIKDATTAELKYLLTRVGPVSGQIEYYRDTERITYERGIFIGWEGNEWIIAKQYIDQSGTYHVTSYSEQRIPIVHPEGGTSSKTTGSVFYYDCRNPAADTPSIVCPCPTDLYSLAADPRIGTICQADCSKKQIDTPEDICPCPDKKDKVAWGADPRTADKTGICSAEPIRVVLSVVAAVLAIPFLVILF